MDSLPLKIDNFISRFEMEKAPKQSRKPAAFPRWASTKRLILPENLRELIVDHIAGDMERMRYNIKFVCFMRGYSLTYAIKCFSEHGIKFDRQSLIYGGRKIAVSLLYLSTWALVLEVPTWLLLSESIQDDCERLGIKRG